MKKIFLLSLFLITAQMLYAQSNVDRLITTLDSLCSYKLDNWKVSPDLKLFKSTNGDPTKSDFDDSQWQTLTLNQSIYPDSCWIRKKIVLPSTYLGKPITGQVKFLVSVDDYGYLYVDGENKGMFPWDGEFVLTNNAKPGQTFLLSIKAINTGGPLRLIRAELAFDSTKNIQQTVSDFSLSLHIGEKLLSFDTYQTSSRQKVDPGIDKTSIAKKERTLLNDLLQGAAASVDFQSLENGKSDLFLTSVSQAKNQIKPVGDFAKKFTIYFTSNAHIDAAWLWRDLETKEVCKNTFSSVINMMNTRADFTYSQSAAAYYDWMEKLYPDLFANIKK